ncbi:Multidrug resistance protein abc superfamily [Globisporangium polare]
MARKDSVRSVKSDHAGAVEAANDESTLKGNFTILDAMAFSRPERKFFVIGMIAAGVNGFALPSSALLISEMVATMTLKYSEFKSDGLRSHLHSLSNDVTLYGLCYVGGAVVIFVFTMIQNFCFKYMAEKLTSRLRDVHFTALCRQNIAFFDEKKNATGALTADLSTNATKVALVSGDSQGRVVQAVFTFVAALVISFATGSWLLTLIMLAVFPLLLMGQVVRMKQMRGSGGLSDELAEVGAHASEALSNIRTVVSLNLEKTISDKFSALLEAPLKQGRREAQINGLALGFSSFIVFATYALVFWYGGVLVNKGDITFKEMMRTLMAIMMSAQGVGSAASFLGESEHAIKSGAAIVAIRDRELPIDSFDESGLKPTKVEGKIEFKNILFRYPTRPEVTVLKNYNLTVEAGQTIAFCGPSGGGKSTCISLIERFYDPVQGEVLLDGKNVKDLNLNWLRSQIGLVGQEPTLFIGTIAENIAYGMECSEEEVEAAAKMANAHDFITRFPDGYKTQVGMKGEQLSGGQKQRIAIARAILKNPEILLLDEATSALDSESEKIVQEALDKVVALKRRTTIIIAHRLSTIRKADKICVVSGGKIAEQGTHSELLSQNGIYARLVESATN